MSEDEAIQEAQRLLQQDVITAETGKALKALKGYISADFFGMLWEAFMASVPVEVLIELDNQ